MTRDAVLQSHLEAVMAEHLEVDRAVTDEGGDIHVRCGQVRYTVRLRVDGGEPHVEVYACALDEVDLDPGLLEELNTLNRRTCRTRVFWSHRTLIVAGETSALRLVVEDLAELCAEVVYFAGGEGPRLAGRYGGSVPGAGEEP